MALTLFNSLTRRKENFIPRMPGRVKLYVCGPTVYDEPHLGHARSAVVFDVMARYLKARGFQVTSVRNITDIDDKIIMKARQLSQDFRRLAVHYQECYQAALERLNVRSPDFQPRATAFIQPIQEAVASLVQSGRAYQVGRDVYFAAAGFPGYGKLAGRALQDLPPAEDADQPPEKRHPADFALWKGAKPHEPAWPSPWGNGRPGWHIECSVMSASLLGPVFDIHGGGTDLIFPHHTNEIAQSEALFGHTPANYWIHNGMVQIAGGKMSKSIGNVLNLRELLALYPPDAVRLFLLSKRYRHPIEYAPGAMQAASKHAARLQQVVERLDPERQAASDLTDTEGPIWFRFCEAMDDDFNFPRALSVVFEAVRRINRQMDGDGTQRGCTPLAGIDTTLSDLAFVCREILGLRLQPPIAVMRRRSARGWAVSVV